MADYVLYTETMARYILFVLAPQPSMDLTNSADDFPLGDICLGLTEQRAATSGSQKKKKPPKNLHQDVNRFHKDKMLLCLLCLFVPIGYCRAS